MTSGFLQLYAQLGVRADCSLDDFKHACRRRIGDIHPDRGDVREGDDGLQMPLDELLALYAQAIQFHQKHGRLPGAAQGTSPQPGAPARPPPAPASGPRAATGRLRATAAATSTRDPMLIVLAAILLLAALAWPGAGRRAPVAEVATGGASAVAAPEAPGQIELGMDRATVAEILGEPLRKDGARWEYGPSWLRFDDDKVVDWYSSPLRPLKTANAIPE